MPKHAFSLLIPTRNRQYYALYAIESALRCSYPHKQILISDNSDDDSLKHLLHKRGWLPKVVYHKTERVLGLRDNWEEAIALATGDIVALMGDDDAIMPDAFHWADVIFQNPAMRQNIEVLASDCAVYKWGDYPLHGRRHFLSFSLDPRLFYYPEPQDILRQALMYKKLLGMGPGLYYGFVKNDFLQRLKAIRGRYVVDVEADFDSGYATLMYAKSYALLGRPLFVQGHSGKSSSGNLRFAAKSFMHAQKFADEAGTALHDLGLEASPNVFTNNGAIVASQLRMLPEIRAALQDPQADIDRVAAWNFIAQSMVSSYENLFFSYNTNALQILAERWGITDKVRLPLRCAIVGDIVREQGPRRDGTDTLDKDTGKKSSCFNRLVVNGRRAGFQTIADAVRHIYATLPDITAFPDVGVRTYAMQQVDAFDAARLQAAQHFYDQKHFQQAENILGDILCENSMHTGALLLLGRICMEQERWEDALPHLARALSLQLQAETLRLYCQTVYALGIWDTVCGVMDAFVQSLPENMQMRPVFTEICTFGGTP